MCRRGDRYSNPCAVAVTLVDVAQLLTQFTMMTVFRNRAAFIPESLLLLAGHSASPFVHSIATTTTTHRQSDGMGQCTADWGASERAPSCKQRPFILYVCSIPFQKSTFTYISAIMVNMGG